MRTRSLHRLLVALAFAALGVSGCSRGPEARPPPPVDPCAGVACQLHAACVPSGEGHACACEWGWISDGAGGCVDPCVGVACQANASCVASGTGHACLCAPGFVPDGAGGCVASTVPALGGCDLFPADHVFNTPIDALPVSSRSTQYLAAIGDHGVHLDLGTEVDQASPSYYGIPYNVVNGDALTWARIAYPGGWPDESDCAEEGATATVVSPCDRAARPVMPVPASPLVEGGIDRTDEDHHLLVVDADTCRLWELGHALPSVTAGVVWDVLCTATYDLRSNALRPDGWTSSDAAGFPILPLLLKQAEAQSGVIRHALRFTIPTGAIRNTYTWPARHRAGSGGATTPPMGQLFRLKASYDIPAGFGVQSKAILQAMKTYGLYLADGGSALFVQGEPSAAWDPAIFDEVQTVRTSDLEAVDLSPFTSRSGWSAGSARVPPQR